LLLVRLAISGISHGQSITSGGILYTDAEEEEEGEPKLPAQATDPTPPEEKATATCA
jgi:hypothetical protein